MGKINEYQRQQLASSTVGVAEPSRAGEIIGQGIVNLGTGVQQFEQTQAKKQEAYDTLAANNALLDWQLGLQQVSYKLREENAGSPGKYPKAFLEKGTESLQVDAMAIKDDKVRTKFLSAGSQTLKGMIPGATEWSAAKSRENALIDVTTAADKIVLNAGNSTNPADLMVSFQSLDETLFVLTKDLADDEKGMGITHSDKIKQWDDYAQQALKAHLSQRLNEPGLLAMDLIQGKYDNIEVETSRGKIRVPLDDETKKEYITKAQNAEVNGEKKKNLNKIIQFEGQSEAVVEKVLSGEWGVAEVNKEYERATNIEGMDPEYIENLSAILQVTLSTRSATAIDDPSVIQPIRSELFALSMEISSRVGKIEEGVISGGQKEKSTEFVSRLLKIRTKMAKAHNEGKMTYANWQAMEREIAPHLMRGILSMEEKGSNRFTRRYRDPYGEHYKVINDDVNDMTNKTNEQKNVLKERGAQAFIDNVLRMRESTPGGELSADQYRTARENAIREISPQRYILGDVVYGKEIIGFNAQGQPIVKVSPAESEKVKRSN